MRVLKDQTLENEILDFDDIYLKNCVVRNCKIFYSGAEFGWESTKIENVQIQLRGAAKRTQEFLSHLGLLKKGKKLPLLSPLISTVTTWVF